MSNRSFDTRPTDGEPQDLLFRLGWNERLSAVFVERYGSSHIPARVVRVEKGFSTVLSSAGEGLARVSGAFEYRVQGPEDYPAVGDWVAIDPVSEGMFRVEAVLPRAGAISRKSAGEETSEQILATNVDIVFIVFSLEGGRKSTPRGAERYITMAWEGGATPVILLNKEDLAEDPGQTLGEIEAAAPGVEVVPVSCYTGSGIEWVASRVSTGRTAVLVGPSGTGKSTLINTLLGEERLETGTIRDADKRGRHTTTSRQLVSLPSGGMLIDTPGLRELQLWADSDALADAFSDIAEFARACRFRDCTHSGEPGCAVQSALADGALDHARYENFLELGKELAYLERRTDDRARQENTRRWKQINKQMRGFTKERRAGG